MLRNCLWQGGESVRERPWKGGGGAWKSFSRRDLRGERRGRSSGFEQRGGAVTPRPGRGAGRQGAERGPGRRTGSRARGTSDFRRGTAVYPPSPLDWSSAPRRPPEVELPGSHGRVSATSDAAGPQHLPPEGRRSPQPTAPRLHGSRRLFGLSPALRPRPQGRSQ